MKALGLKSLTRKGGALRACLVRTIGRLSEAGYSSSPTRFSLRSLVGRGTCRPTHGIPLIAMLLAATALPAAAQDFAYTINSEPAGYVDLAAVAAAGTVVRTPALQGEVAGWMFAYWKIDGVRQADARGVAVPAATFTLTGPTTATAVYFRASDDTDTDGVPDWFEWQQFGNLDQTAVGDSDGDGFNHAVEAWRGYSPKLADMIVDGGVAARRSARLLFVPPGQALYTINSEPAGYANQSGIGAIGAAVTTSALQGEASGWVFAYWKVNGVRQADASGVAVPAATFSLSGPTTATAVYLRVTDDIDGDGVPDWYEWKFFGGLDQAAAGDIDGDGFSHAVEAWRGYSARLVDTIADGGVAARRSTKLLFVAPGQALYSINSEPTGYVNQSGIAALGTTVTTTTLQGESSGWTFAYWKVNGVRQADVSGTAIPAASFALSGPTTVTAVYVRTTDDTDGDGVPDWYEWKYFGGLGQVATGDTDGDSLNNAVESWRGSSPRLVDTIMDGGVATRRSPALLFSAALVPAAPVISTHPQSQTVVMGTNVTFTVLASGNPTPAYQWRKGGVALPGATTANLTITGAQVADSGTYTVTVTNSAGSRTSEPVVFLVAGGTLGASHVVMAGGFVPGSQVTVTNTMTYSGVVALVDWQVVLPAGFSLASETATAQTRPAAGTASLLEWSWSTVPLSPITFTYTLYTPASATESPQIAALATLRFDGGSAPIRLLAQPDPLTIPIFTLHTADTDRNSRISLLELTRVIELYNTRTETVRTGQYHVHPPNLEDGFGSGLAGSQGNCAPGCQAPPPYHSADTDRNGKVSLLELTRVIELYNYRSGTVRTGQYHVQAGTEDGFAPGP